MKSFQLYIPNPCSQSWSEMTIEDSGRHCAQCDKVVVDFSKMSDEQIVEFMDKNHGKICGNFKVSQLKRNIDDFNPYPRISLRKVLLGLTFYALTQPTTMLGRNLCVLPQQEQVATDESMKDEIVPNTTGDSITYVIKGKVRHFEKPISGATVKVAGYNASAISNENGYFKLEISLPSYLKEISLVSSLVGFEDRTVLVKTKSLQAPLVIEMKNKENLMRGEVILIKPNR